jgi:putative ABC transport system substrate-binding protein
VSRFAEGSAALTAFREALTELGYVEGHNIVIERRDAEGRFQRLREMAKELIGLGCEVLLAPSNIDAEAAKGVTSTVPIVFVGADPVGTGLVKSLQRPGGNVTGLTVASHARGRRMALLKELVPGLTRAAVLVNLAYTSVPFQLRQTELAAQSLAVPLRRFEVRDAKDLGDALGGVATPTGSSCSTTRCSCARPAASPSSPRATSSRWSRRTRASRRPAASCPTSPTCSTRTAARRRAWTGS